MRELTKQLQKLGFQIKMTERIGPCDNCTEWNTTYYNPESKKWMCEECIYNV